MNGMAMDGGPPLDIAAGNGNLDLVRLLVEHGAKLDEGTMFSAAMGAKLEVVKYLTEHGAIFRSLGRRVGSLGVSGKLSPQRRCLLPPGPWRPMGHD